jgi:hypothetical protein
VESWGGERPADGTCEIKFQRGVFVFGQFEDDRHDSIREQSAREDFDATDLFEDAPDHPDDALVRVHLHDLLERDDDTLLDGSLVRGSELRGEVVDEIDAVDLDGSVEMRSGDGSDERSKSHVGELVMKDFMEREVAESSDRELDAENRPAGGRGGRVRERRGRGGGNLLRMLTKVGTATELASAMPFSRKDTLKMETEAQYRASSLLRLLIA